MYDGFYKLTRKPFQLNADNDFFFKSEIHKRALAYMRYGLTKGEGFIVITGMPGTGKTMLIKQLAGSINPEKVTFGVLVSAQLGADDLLKMIAATFKLPYEGDDKATLLGKLERFFIGEAERGRRLLVIVDEAQNLPKSSLEELRMLSNFERSGKSLLQLFLMGQDQFNKTLALPDMEQFRQRVVASYQLKPLSEDQTKNYIMFRLKRAGWLQWPQFADDAFPLLFRHSKGIPRKINTLCERVLMLGFLDELQSIDGSVVQAVLDDIAEEGGAEAIPPDDVGSFAPDSLAKRVAVLEKTLQDMVKILQAFQESLDDKTPE